MNLFDQFLVFLGVRKVLSTIEKEELRHKEEERIRREEEYQEQL